MIIDRNNIAQSDALASQYRDLLKSGMAPHPQSPAGSALLRAYTDWKARDAAQGTAAVKAAMRISSEEKRAIRQKAERKAGKKAARKLKRARNAVGALAPGTLEARADKRGRKAARRAVARRQVNPGMVGYRAYRAEGGKLTAAAWARRLKGLDG
jgi:hypothetical protein